MSVVGTATRIASELRAICGAEHVIDDPDSLRQYALLGVVPANVVTPSSVDEIAAILRVANQHNLGVVPAGGLTQQNVGSIPDGIDVMLVTTRLKDVEHYDQGDLTVGVGAGFTVAELSEMVARDGLLFALESASPERETIGGVLATAAHGPLRHGYGPVRDFCIGLRFVTGDGRRAKGGGRVVKNVAGYDLMKLLIGSYGTLGIITSASFKLFPAPRQTRTFLAEFAALGGAIQFRDRILRSPLTPICLELVSPTARDIMRPEAAHSDAWVICVRASGSDAVLARYRNELGSDVSRELEGQAEQDLWRALREFPKAARLGHPESLLLSLSVPLGEVKPAIDTLSSIVDERHAAVAFTGRIGTGHIQIALWSPDGDAANVIECVKRYRDVVSRASLLVRHHAPDRRFEFSVWGSVPTSQSMEAVKKVLDPNDILNRGRFGF